MFNMGNKGLNIEDIKKKERDLSIQDSGGIRFIEFVRWRFKFPPTLEFYS